MPNAVRICVYMCVRMTLSIYIYTCLCKKDFCTWIGRFGESQSGLGVSQYQECTAEISVIRV